MESQAKGKENEVEQETEDYENKETIEEQSYCTLVRDTWEKPIVQVDQQTISIGERKEPITYY